MAKKKRTPAATSNFIRPALKAAYNYVKKHGDLKEEDLNADQRLRLIEAYRLIFDAEKSAKKQGKKFKNVKKRAKTSKKKKRGNFIGSKISKARNYLKRASKYPPEKRKDKYISLRIQEAKHVIKSAEQRNRDRKVRRASASEGRKLSKELSTNRWEEVTGPNGEIIRFKLDFYTSGEKAGKLRRRIRSKQEPQQGDIVLDATGPAGPDQKGGIRAWRMASNRRRKHPVSKEMIENYKQSNLYMVRQLAAGQISLQQFADFIQAELNKPSSKDYQARVRTGSAPVTGWKLRRKRRRR